MDQIQELMELESLRRLKGLYFYLMDTKQWDRWLALFMPDATLQWDLGVSREGREVTTIGFAGKDEIEKHVIREILEPAICVHHGFTPVLDLHSETEATGIWAMEDLVIARDQSLLHGYGHYHETYHKVEGSWRFASIHLKRVRIDSSRV